MEYYKSELGDLNGSRRMVDERADVGRSESCGIQHVGGV